MNHGAVIENAVADALMKNNIDIFYYDTKKPTQIEIDFVIQRDNTVLPIEVKSGKDYKIHASLTNAMKKYDELEVGIVLCDENISVEDNITYIPLYMTFLINNTLYSDFTFS